MTPNAQIRPEDVRIYVLALLHRFGARRVGKHWPVIWARWQRKNAPEPNLGANSGV